MLAAAARAGRSIGDPDVEHPALMVGFALSTAALLTVPVLNLAFRPIVIVGASHIIGQLEIASTPTSRSR